jgi:hypothetical protein
MCFVFVPESGTGRVLSAEAALSLISDIAEGTPERIPDQIPDDEACALARQELKNLVVKRGEDARSVVGLFLHAAVWLDPVNSDRL